MQRELTARNATLEKQQDELVWLATRDALTALYNRREFMRLLGKLAAGNNAFSRAPQKSG